VCWRGRGDFRAYGRTDLRRDRRHQATIIDDSAAPDEPVFKQVLERFYDGEPDPATDRLL
jgi:hypothetical protein